MPSSNQSSGCSGGTVWGTRRRTPAAIFRRKQPPIQRAPPVAVLPFSIPARTSPLAAGPSARCSSRSAHGPAFQETSARRAYPSRDRSSARLSLETRGAYDRRLILPACVTKIERARTCMPRLPPPRRRFASVCLLASAAAEPTLRRPRFFPKFSERVPRRSGKWRHRRRTVSLSPMLLVAVQKLAP